MLNHTGWIWTILIRRSQLAAIRVAIVDVYASSTSTCVTSWRDCLPAICRILTEPQDAAPNPEPGSHR